MCNNQLAPLCAPSSRWKEVLNALVHLFYQSFSADEKKEISLLGFLHKFMVVVVGGGGGVWGCFFKVALSLQV